MQIPINKEFVWSVLNGWRRTVVTQWATVYQFDLPGLWEPKATALLLFAGTEEPALAPRGLEDMFRSLYTKARDMQHHRRSRMGDIWGPTQWFEAVEEYTDTPSGTLFAAPWTGDIRLLDECSAIRAVSAGEQLGFRDFQHTATMGQVNYAIQKALFGEIRFDHCYQESERTA